MVSLTCSQSGELPHRIVREELATAPSLPVGVPHALVALPDPGVAFLLQIRWLRRTLEDGH